MATRRKTTLLYANQHSLGVPAIRSNASAIATLTDPTLTPDYGTIERLLASPYLTPSEGSESFKSGTLSCTLECQPRADGSPTSAPVFHNFLRASGLRGERTKRVPIGTVSNGPVYHGSHYTQATSLAEGWNIGHIVNGDSHAYLWADPWINISLTGTNTLTFDVDAEGVAYSTPPTVVISSGTYQDAYSYWPQSTPIATFNYDAQTAATLEHGTIFQQTDATQGIAYGRVEMPFHRKVSGNGPAAPGDVGPPAIKATCPVYFQHFDGTERFAYNYPTALTTVTYTDGSGDTLSIAGTSVMQAYANLPMTLLCNYDGPEIGIHSARANVTWRLRNGDRGLMEFEFQGAAVQPSDETPPAFPGSGGQPPPVIGGTYLLGTIYNPRFSEVTVSMGAEVGLREDPSQDSGYIGGELSARTPTVSMDPELVQEIQFDMLEKGYSKGTFRTQLAWGGGTNNGGNFVLQGFQTQVASVGIGDRVGLTTADVTLNLTGSGDDELVFHVW